MKTLSHYALTLLLAVASLNAPIAVGQGIPKPASNRQGGELSLTELVGRHPLVFEGHVVGQRSFWNASHTKILTATTIEVFTVFKGNVGPTMEIITDGGVVGEEGMGVFDGDQPALGKSSAGLFFAQPYSKNDLAANASAAPAVEVNAGAQGYWMYQRPARAMQTVAITPYRVYDDIPTLVQAPIAAAAGQAPRVLKSFDARRFDPFAATAPLQQKVTTPVTPQKKTASQTGAEAAAAPNSPTAAPVITGFSPTSLKAGTFDVLTINGTDFGTAKPRVFFTSSNNDASIECPPENIFSFTNTTIQLYVPSNDGTSPPFGISAGTGPIYIESNNIRSNVPNTDLTIIRSETTYNDPLITPTAYRQTRLVSANGAGGYTFKYDQNIYNTPEAVRLIEAALQKWRCETLVNIGDDVSAATPYVQGTPECNISFAPSGTMGARLMSTYGYFRTCSNSATNGRFVYTTAMDIQVNPDKFWNYSLEGDPYSADEYDFKTSILHELGHAIGLQHVKDPSKLMYSFLAPQQARYYLSAEPEVGGGANILDRSTRQQTCTSNSYTAMQALAASNCQGGQPSTSLDYLFVNRCTLTPATVALTASGGTNYVWAGKDHFNNTNPTTATVTATTAPYTPIGVYSTRNGLGGTALTYIYFEENVQCPPGGGGSASRTSAYPNPSASDLTVDYQPAPGRQDVELVLHNGQGTIVQTFRYPGNSQRRTFPVRGLNRGLYYLRTVENGRTQGTLRLMIE